VGFSLSVIEIDWDQSFVAFDKTPFVIANIKEKRWHATQDANVEMIMASRAAAAQSGHASSLFIG
jgi:hypothetical protein